mmetsp:Transcript_30810/g.62682  ORF Transcript_30810/g.62682 Transcript_30810/m.62682 type:complete len:125 (-) Transcript_30810:66-440(-)
MEPPTQHQQPCPTKPTKVLDVPQIADDDIETPCFFNYRKLIVFSFLRIVAVLRESVSFFLVASRQLKQIHIVMANPNSCDSITAKKELLIWSNWYNASGSVLPKIITRYSIQEVVPDKPGRVAT